jgi:hypothetical protein
VYFDRSARFKFNFRRTGLTHLNRETQIESV